MIHLDNNITIEDEYDANRWLEDMLEEWTEHKRPSNSKKPRKEAHHLFLFKCSECNAKYKTKTGYQKHLNDNY